MSSSVPFESAARGERSMPPLKRLVEILNPDRGDLVAVTVFAFAIGGLMLATPIAVQALVNFVAFGGAKTPVLALALLLACGLGIAALLSAVQTWIVEILQRRVFVRTVAQVTHRLPRVDPRNRELWYGPELVNRFLDVVTLQKSISFLLLDGLGVVLGVVLGMLVLAFYHPILLAFDLVIVLAVAVIVFGLGRTGVDTAIGESKAKYAVLSWLEEIARQPVAFKEPGAQDYLVDRTDDLTRAYVLARTKHYGVLFRQIVATLGLQVAASVSLLGVGGLLVVRGELTLGQLVAAELIVTYVVGSVAKMGKHLEAFYDLMGATDKLGKLLDVPLERSGGESWSRQPSARGAALCVNDVMGVSFDVRPGGRVALTGGSGSGKTTLLETIYGLHRPETGTVQVDGLDVRTVCVDSLRERVALAGEIEIFEGTLSENVKLGRPIAAEVLQDALRCAGLLDEVLDLPEGIDTPLNAHGSPLSHGQAVRLMIARAIASRPGLVLIDGLLDSLPASEMRPLVQALSTTPSSWTLLVSSRRSEVLQQFDEVVDLGGRRKSSLEVAG